MNNELNKKHVTYPIACGLKLIGYDMPTIFGFDNKGNLRSKIAHSTDGGCSISWDRYDSHIYAPLWQDAIDFLIEKYKCWIDIQPMDNLNIFRMTISYYGKQNNWNDIYYDNYYDARLFGIQEAINLISKE